MECIIGKIKNKLYMRKIRKIIIHCSATQEGKDIDAKEIKRWHVEKRGWSYIGYHYVIKLDGTVEEGRPIERSGAHTLNHNHTSIGVCYIGGVEKKKKKVGDKMKWIPKDTRTKKQKDSLQDLLLQIKCDFPNASVHGHNEFSSKSCPCFDAHSEYAWISNLK